MIKQNLDGSVDIQFDNGRKFKLWFMEDGTNSVAIEDEQGKEIERLGADSLVEFLYEESHLMIKG